MLINLQRGRSLMLVLALVLGCASVSFAQSTTGSISGNVADTNGGAVPAATVTARNTETGVTRTIQTNDDGVYRITNLPVGMYEVTIEAPSFGRYVQTGITLSLNQDAVVDAALQPAGVQEVVTIAENAALLNTTTAEVSTRFDSRRLSEVPLATNRNVFAAALSAPGVSQLGAGQTGFASGVSYSANGGRVRSNNFQIDGQDTNDPSVSGGQQSINNPDIVQEVRLITNQFLPEYGRNAGSVLNIVTKSGTNDFNGSLFWFHNNNKLNALSNTDKARGLTEAPFRIENQIGGTIGGPVYLPRFGEGGPAVYRGRDKTFFFGSFQRWSDRQAGSGTTLRNGAPTEAGRALLQSLYGNRPQVQALLRFLPVAQNSTGATVSLASINGPDIPVGNITGSAAFRLDDYQITGRIDHNFSEANRLSARYLYDDLDSGGTGQATPTNLTTVSPSRAQSVNLSLTSILSPRLVNEARVAFSRLGTTTSASDPSSQEIPSIEISNLGLLGFNGDASRTAIGLAVNLPQFRTNNTYQVQNNISYIAGSHSTKFGADIRRTQVKSFFVPTIRGRLAYSTLANFINDIADLGASINRPLPGGQELQYYNYYDAYFFGQDEWKIRPNFTLTYGLRYELPGNSVDDLVPINDSIVARAGGDERYRFTPVPKTDVDNIQPRIGFNYAPRGGGIFKRLTGDNDLVFRGGYARTHDASFVNINLNIASAFPFVATIPLPTANAFTNIGNAQVTGLNPIDFARTVVAEDFRAPVYDQFSAEVQRSFGRDIVLRVGYVGTRGRDLFQTIDGNPFKPRTTPCTVANPCTLADRVDPTQGTIRLRTNTGESDYHSLQSSLERRLSRGFSAGVHFTYSSFIDDASEIFNPSTGEVAVPQDSFNTENDRGRSAYDRPLRLTGNFVYELPFFSEQRGAVGHLLGGFQVSSFFTFQSGAPFTVLLGSDPLNALTAPVRSVPGGTPTTQGIANLVGNAVRPNLNTTMNLGSMSIEEILLATGGTVGARALFSPLAAGQRVGNAGRNILRADGINNINIGITKNTNITEGTRLQIRADMFNATNTRDFGIPNGTFTSGNFLNQWATNGGNRRIQIGARLVF